MSGLGVDTGEIASAATAIRASAQAIAELRNDISNPRLAGRDFGRAHGAAAASYFDGLRKLVQAVGAHATAVGDYANTLSSAARSYDDNEVDGAGTVRGSGNEDR